MSQWPRQRRGQGSCPAFESELDEFHATVLGFAGGGRVGSNGLGGAFAIGLQAAGIDGECFDERIFDRGGAFLRESEILGGIAVAIGVADDLYVHGGIVFQDVGDVFQRAIGLGFEDGRVDIEEDARRGEMAFGDELVAGVGSADGQDDVTEEIAVTGDGAVM